VCVREREVCLITASVGVLDSSLCCSRLVVAVVVFKVLLLEMRGKDERKERE